MLLKKYCVCNKVMSNTSPTFPSLTCCGGSPNVCQSYPNTAKCPRGSEPQFCCTSTGQITPASVTLDANGNTVSVCTNYGDVPYNSYDPNVCKKAPVYSCCNNNYCYQSKDDNCDYWGTVNSPSIGGMYVSDCSQCGPTVSCCFPGQFCQINSKDTGCPARESYKVSDCNQCPTDDFNF